MALCAEVFDTDELGYAVVKQSEVGAELHSRVRLAEQNCPEGAISIE